MIADRASFVGGARSVTADRRENLDSGWVGADLVEGVQASARRVHSPHP